MPEEPWSVVPDELRELTAPEERLHDLVEAVYTVVSDLDVDRVLQQLVTAAVRLVDAEYGALGLLEPESGSGERRLAQFVPVGMNEATIQRIGHWPRGEGVLGAVLSGDSALRLDDLTRHPAFRGWPAGHPPMHSFLGVPVRMRDTILGDLYLANKRGGGPFTDEDERIIDALGVIAAVKIINVRMYDQVQRDTVRRQQDSAKIAVMEDRDRIARDLHDSVIQRIYASGLALQGALRMHPTPDVADRLERVVADLDDTIQDIRGTIFSLQSTSGGQGGLQSEISELVTRAARHLGFTPALRQKGPIEAVVPPDTARQAMAVLRESLSNVVRHADATRIEVAVTAARGELRISVADNGIGVGEAPRRGGLRNIAERATELDGVVEIGLGLDGRGTTVVWRVPIPGA
ncbi:Redox sensor histidine kinase response regulator DevS [Nocardia seriolae]|uniref:Redox sensor histidine kinase response regulator DevS n=1 Tax=Nocardia seriolae TaxID=37332 RepID=A0ABC8B3H7_9NOCA|nr:GAF domain-containing sensor histidine kinase [Nocardia seriolae]APB00924.1 Redox sensor histidine kinase response regulator DevS [Nocardia seriolae]